MESVTKNKQNQETISKMADKFFGPLKMECCRELTEGYFNVAYEVCLNNGRKVILKIAPTKETRVMTYEKNIMFSEVEAMKMVGSVDGIPAPDVLGYDDSCTICESPYFFMEKLEGASLNIEKGSLPPDRIEAIRMEVGKINRRINEISCPCFGYPGQPDFQGREWYPVFRKMMEAGIRDAENGNVELRISIDTLRDCLEKDKGLFEEVTEPKLVHWDCWDGNIFVKDGRITGIIDWERSLWGDPLMEVGFRTYSGRTSFLKGYNIVLSPNQKRRALWYDIYLLLLMTLECEYRQYETQDVYNWAAQMLEKQFMLVAEKD